MGKTVKNKRDKVPKITEEEYVQYIATLKNETDRENVPVVGNGQLQNNTVQDNKT